MDTTDIDIKAVKLGSLPIIDKYLKELCIESLFERFVEIDPRDKIPVWKTLSIMLRNIIIEKHPLYQIGEWALNRNLIKQSQSECMTDDRIGRSLDRLFKSDRAGLITDVILKAVDAFNINIDRVHNDSTTVTLYGNYKKYEDCKSAKPRNGINKDHRPDLKQLLFSLSVADDNAFPLYFKVWDGNITDDTTHIRNWMALRNLLGRADFTYVADSKLCVRESLAFISTEGGKFVTIVPETRSEISRFKDWIQTNSPTWKQVIAEPNPRGENKPPRIYWTFDSPFLSSEGFRIVWVKSSLKQINDQQRRTQRLDATEEEFRILAKKKNRNRDALEKEACRILTYFKTKDLIDWQISIQSEDIYKQSRRGRPDERMTYRKTTKTTYQLVWCQKSEKVLFESRYDGIFPLITNLKNTSSEILDIYKYQPRLEKRFEQLKTVYHIAPMFLKNTQRIEASLLLYFLALMISSLIERTVRKAMEASNLVSIPIYPEERACKNPTADKILESFEDIRLQFIMKKDQIIKTIPDQLTKKQKLILSLLKIQPSSFFNLSS